MVNLNDVLLAASNIPVDDPIAEIWGRGLQGGYKIIEFTGALPITIRANGDTLIDYRIYGADGGVGEPTENLFDPENCEVGLIAPDGSIRTSATQSFCTDFIEIPEGATYATLSQEAIISKPAINDYIVIARYGAEKKLIQRNFAYVSTSAGAAHNILISSDAKYIRASIVAIEPGANASSVKPMLNLGSEALQYEPYGYKLPMTVQSENLLDRKNSVNGKYLVENGGEGNQSNFAYTDFLKVNASIPYTITNYDGSLGGTAAICFYDANFDFLYGITYYSRNSITFTPETNVAYVRCSYKTTDRVSLSLGSTVPTTYVPYSETIAPVYIGENQLDVGEYVSFSEQKIYREVSGTLTPTDPPVSFPDIPTIEGETIIDYDGTPKPSQVYVKYKG